MADDGQQRFEDYIELENYIEELQAKKVAHPPEDLTPEQVRIYQMAVLFHTATDDNAEPRPEFVAQLKSQLLEMRAQPQTVQSEPAELAPKPDVHLIFTETVAPPALKRGSTQPIRFFSRRGLLTGGAVAAASLVIGAGIGSEEQKEQNKPAVTLSPGSYQQTAGQQLQIPTSIPTRWHFVITLADLGNNAVRFTSDSIVGHVIRTINNTDWGNNVEHVVAFSATCTHMGCLVQWKNTDRQFHCPCHGATFSEQGTQVVNNYQYKLSPLVRLNTKIEGGNVYVEVPL